MKRIHLIIICLLISAGAVYSQEMQQEKFRRFSLSAGPAVYITDPGAFWGGTLVFDFMLSPNQRLSLEMRGGRGGSQQTGSYGYTITTQDGSDITTETFNDGKISYGYNVADFLFSYSWLFTLSEKWTLHVGPSAGLLSVNGSDSYSPKYYRGTEIKGLPKSKMESKYAFTGGVTAGVRWSFAKRWYLDMNYRLSANTGVSFPQRSMYVLGQTVSVESRKFGPVGNSIGVLLGFRF